MPPYNTLYPPPAIYTDAPLNSFLVFKAEALAINEYSQQVSLPSGRVGLSKGVRVVIDFNQNPTNVEILVVEADNDAAGSADYTLVPTAGDLTQANLMQGPNGASTRLATDLIPIAGQSVALFVKTPPSAGGTTCTARITRAA